MTHPPWHVMAEPRHAGDALQRPLRFRFPPRLRLGVDMTSNAKSRQQSFLGRHEVLYPRCIGKAGASKIRRLILLISMGRRWKRGRAAGVARV
jgi:hypothetical protein